MLTFLAICGVVFWFYKTKHSKQPVDSVGASTSSPQNHSKEVTYKTAEGRYLFNGTIVLARAVEKYARGKYTQPFSQLNTLNPEKYDAWTANLECPITNNQVSYETQVNNLVFNCRPEWLPELTKNFQILNLANNHTGDQGVKTGMQDTQKYLSQTKSQFFGNYDPSVINDICEVVALPIRAKSHSGQEQKATLPVAFCGWHYFNFNRGPTQQELDVIKQYYQYMPVFGFIEMGAEYQAEAGAAQRSIAKAVVDAGADMVLANNPHWVQDSEVYKGKLIVYSLGNFIFDQIDAETQRGVSIDMTLGLHAGDLDETMDKWLSFGQECAAFKDSCLEKIKQQKLGKLKFDLIFNTPVASQGGAGKITHRASPEVQQAVEKRLRWQETKKQLGQ